MPAVQQVELNEPVTLEHRFWNPDTGAAFDPGTVSLAITDPTGAVTNVAQGGLTHPSTGVWRYTLVPGVKGLWRYFFDPGAAGRSEVEFLLVAAGAPSAPCSTWATVGQLQACGKVPAGASEGAQEQALYAATDLLWRWSGYKYPGLCLDMVRPCAQNSYLEYQPPWDRLVGGWSGGWSWGWNRAWGTCLCNASSHRGCGCRFMPEVKLGRDPVAGIVQVKQDGAVLAQSTYRLDDYGWLVRTDGLAWPCCQDLSKDDTQPNTWSVQFVWGKNPPPAGVQACVDLATEIVAYCAGGDCTLPREVSTLIRQGETAIFPLPGAYGKDAAGIIRAGLKSVDRFLGAVGTSRPAVVASPDVDAMVRRTGT